MGVIVGIAGEISIADAVNGCQTCICIIGDAVSPCRSGFLPYIRIGKRWDGKIW
jgi:hypothetical protein